ncbi:glycosyltransferase family 39 protein [Rothia kristinae]|uniref:ArnT family glycosyltransferase n=1 Tax=Rothia kristinae TaxID=37923 RepID=UPI001CD55BC4|nr:glycosyltransferase family 39 protein [Rothia kristinae]MCA1169150.1 glycosyltransferase family 39 protein [Rothia kristinae]
MATQSLPKRPARSPRIARSRRFRRHDDVVEPPTATTARVRWSWPAWLLLAVTAAAYLWNLGANGWGNGFYAAAAQAGADNWEAFLFGSSDIGNSITVDKPPASLWPMALSVKLFGLSTWSLMVPEVLMGVASVALVYASVARAVGRGPGLLAGYALAATPVAALMFRYDNPEALLLLLMSLAAYATVRAIDSGRIRWMVLCGAALGFAFLTKQLQGLLVVPGFGLAYLVLARGTLRRRLAGLAAALAALVVAAGWWVALVMLTPASDRPYIGGSQTNSFWDLTFGYNGLGRISGEETGSVGGGATASPTMFRMFDSSFGGQISWLMPAAIILTAAALWITRRAARTDRRRATLVVWGSWFLTTWVVFSIMQGIQHAYYSVALAPAIAAMIGTGAAIVWDAARAERWFARDVADTSAGMSVTGVPEEEIAVDPQTAPLHRADVGQAPRREAPERVGSWREALAGGTWQFAVLGFCTAITGVWAFVLLGRDGYLPLLRWMILFLALISGAALAFGAQLHRQLLGLAVAGAVLASLAGPTAYTAATLSTGHTGSIITAGPGGGGMGAPGGGGGGGAAAGGGPGGSGGGSGAGGTGGAGGNGGGSAGAAGSGQTSAGASGAGQGAASTGEDATQPGAAGGAGGGMGGVGLMLNTSEPSDELISYLSQDADRYQWMLAVVGSNNAAGYQLASGESVMPVGGYNGTDPAPTLEEFQKLVAQGKIHYYIAGTISSGMGGSSSGSDAAEQIDEWVQAHFTSATVDGTTVYDLTDATQAGS